MNVMDRKNKEGFTIIEVVLVLAIAALIFLMVFIALPALQRNQRDTARKTVLGKITSALTSYQGNTRGSFPGINTSTGAATAGTFQSVFAGYVDGTAATSPGGSVAAGLSLENGTYHLVISNRITATPTGGNQNAYVFNTTGRIGATAGTQIGTQVVEIVPGAKCATSGDSIELGNKRNAAVLIGLENGNASLCQDI